MKKLGVFIPIFLTIVLAFSIIPATYAATELYYDDGSNNGSTWNDAGQYLAVKFSLPAGWTKAKLLSARYYIYSDIADFNVHIFASDLNTRLFGPMQVNPTTFGWFDVDLSAYNIIVTGDFYVAIEYLIDDEPTIAWDLDDPDNMRSYYTLSDSWFLIDDADYMIRAVVEEYTPPVGGIFYCADKIGLLSPWIAAISIIGCIAIVSILVKKRRA